MHIGLEVPVVLCSHSVGLAPGKTLSPAQTGNFLLVVESTTVQDELNCQQ